MSCIPKNLIYVVEDKLRQSVSDKIRGGAGGHRSQLALFSLRESCFPVNKGTHHFSLENCILLQRKTLYFTKVEIALLLSILNDSALHQQPTLLDNLLDLTVY